MIRRLLQILNLQQPHLIRIEAKKAKINNPSDFQLKKGKFTNKRTRDDGSNDTTNKISRSNISELAIHMTSANKVNIQSASYVRNHKQLEQNTFQNDSKSNKKLRVGEVLSK